MTLEDPNFDIVESDNIVAVDYAVGHLFDENDTSAMFDVESHERVCFGADQLREVADHIDRVAGRETDDTDSRGRWKGWDVEEDVIMQNDHNTVGLVAADTHGKVMDGDAQSVFLQTGYLREAVELAEDVHDSGEVWLSIQRGRPVIIQADGDDESIAVSACPLVGHEFDSPTEDL